jgi:hypothetical protein
VPSWVEHYRVAAMPDYLDPLQSIGEADDFTSPTRLLENSTRYINPPGAKISDISLFPLRKILAEKSFTKECRATISNWAIRGRIPIRFDAIITTPARMKALDSTPRK